MTRFCGHKYQCTVPFGGTRHHWELRSQQGGIHYHALIYDGHLSCGLEYHSATPLDDSAPSHLDCPITGGRCWHDGTSLYAEELWPEILAYLRCGDHQSVFRILEREHDEYFRRVGVLPEPEEGPQE